jgi:NAD(P)-dependent dehydrogenase (short-subunit alcohol dehydrogenase family)
VTTRPAVLITGGLTGIGRSTALAFAEQSARVVISGRHQDIGDRLADELRDRGAEAEFVHADVRYENEVQHMVEYVVERFGQLDIAINNAGTGRLGPIVQQTPETYADMFDTNVLGTLLSMKHEMLAMKTQERGSIVNLSSVFGVKGFPGAALYVASKHAIIGLTKTGALEGAPWGIRVNAVAPGPVQTNMLDQSAGSEKSKAAFIRTVPQRRAGEPDEIARAIVFVASQSASYMTGQTICLDGGMTAG